MISNTQIYIAFDVTFFIVSGILVFTPYLKGYRLNEKSGPGGPLLLCAFVYSVFLDICGFGIDRFYAGIVDIRLGCRKARDGHAERRAGNVRKTRVVAEFDGGRVAAVFAADAQLDIGSGRLAAFDGYLHQLAYADLVQTGEGIGFKYLLLVVVAEELARVVTAEAERHLGEVVGAEGEEFRFLGDLVRGERRAGNSIIVPMW